MPTPLPVSIMVNYTIYLQRLSGFVDILLSGVDSTDIT